MDFNKTSTMLDGKLSKMTKAGTSDPEHNPTTESSALGADCGPPKPEESQLTAATRLFNTAELIEHIIHYLPSGEIVRARQYSKYIDALVMNSKKLHESIYTNSEEIIMDMNAYEEYEEHDWVRLHGSWRRHMCDSFRILNINKRLMALGIDVEIHSEVSRIEYYDGDRIEEIEPAVYVSFDGWDFLNAAAAKVEEDDFLTDYFGSRTIDVHIWFDKGTKKELQSRYFEPEPAPIFGELYDVVLTQALADREPTSTRKNMPLHVTLMFPGCVREQNRFARNARRSFEIPTRGDLNKRKEYDAEKKLKQLVEKAGRELYDAGSDLHLEPENDDGRPRILTRQKRISQIVLGEIRDD